jgi:glucans biosynthesis protein C
MPQEFSAEISSRRFDLDWVRIGAFGLLIFYHVGVFYAPGPTAVGATSPRTLPWLLIPMLMVNPWRLLLLFVVSGAATRFMWDKMQAGALLASRSRRFLIPLAFGVAVIVPPQCFVQVVERCGYSGNYWDFWRRYLDADQHLCANGPHLIVPTWNHLWFVADLWMFTVLLVAVLFAAPQMLASLQRLADRTLAGRGMLLWPACWLAFAWLVLERRLPPWYSYAVYLPAFLLGFAIAKSGVVWEGIARMRRMTLIGAVLTYCAMIGLAVVVLGPHLNWGDKMASRPSGGAEFALRTLGATVYGLNQWLWILAVLGFAHRYLRTYNGPVRRYLTDAIFPFYIIHQTTIEVVAHYLAKERLPLGAEATLLIGATIASCFVTYEIARRIGTLRLLFGLNPTAAPRTRPWRTASGLRSDDTA